jgi:hypothetical protein
MPEQSAMLNMSFTSTFNSNWRPLAMTPNQVLP